MSVAATILWVWLVGMPVAWLWASTRYDRKMAAAPRHKVAQLSNILAQMGLPMTKAVVCMIAAVIWPLFLVIKAK